MWRQSRCWLFDTISCCFPRISETFFHAAAHLDQSVCPRKDTSQIMRKLETARINFSSIMFFVFFLLSVVKQAEVGQDCFISRRQSNRHLVFHVSLPAPDTWTYAYSWLETLSLLSSHSPPQNNQHLLPYFALLLRLRSTMSATLKSLMQYKYFNLWDKWVSPWKILAFFFPNSEQL